MRRKIIMAKTKDALKILDRRIGRNRNMRQLIEAESVQRRHCSNDLRCSHSISLTQEELAKRVGTKQPVIARLEDADYEGHSLNMLQRIAKALNRTLRVEMPQAAGR